MEHLLFLSSEINNYHETENLLCLLIMKNHKLESQPQKKFCCVHKKLRGDVHHVITHTAIALPHK